jgi:hypothetical protein
MRVLHELLENASKQWIHSLQPTLAAPENSSVEALPPHASTFSRLRFSVWDYLKVWWYVTMEMKAEVLELYNYCPLPCKGISATMQSFYSFKKVSEGFHNSCTTV